MNTPIAILKIRLASGEINLDEYHKLVTALTSNTDSPPLRERTTLPHGSVLAEVDGIRLYKEAIFMSGTIFPLADIESVKGKNFSESINFIPASKWTYLRIKFTSGETIKLDEHRTILGGARHKAIASMYSQIKRITFQSRLNNLAAKLIREGKILLYKPIGKEQAVFLTRDARIEAGTNSISLKAAKAHGSFGIGVEWQSLGLSRGYDTDEVVISEKKGTLGFIPLGALKFDVNNEDADVANSLMTWLAEPNNVLSSAAT